MEPSDNLPNDTFPIWNGEYLLNKLSKYSSLLKAINEGKLMNALQAIPVTQNLGVTMSRAREMFDALGFNNKFKVEHIRDGKVLDTYHFKNDIVNVGKNLLLNVMFFGATAVAAADWCLGLISSSSYSALAAADTMGSHAGWTEFTGYSQSTRVAWGQATSSAQSTTNSSPVTFDVNATGTVKGIFVTSEDTKGGTTGTLWATALFNADVPVISGDQFRITYTVNA